MEGVSYQYLAIFHNPSPICIKGFYDAFYRKYVEDLRHFPAYYYVLMGNNNTAKDGIISLSNEKLYKWHKKLFPKRELIYIMPYWAQLSPVFNRIKESLNIPELSDEKKLVYENKMLRWAMCSSKLMGSGLVGLSSDKSYIYPSNIFDYEGLAYWCKRALEYVDYVSENVKWDSFIDVIRTRDDKNASFKKKQLTMALSCAETGHKIKRKKYFNDIENCFKDD